MATEEPLKLIAVALAGKATERPRPRWSCLRPVQPFRHRRSSCRAT